MLKKWQNDDKTFKGLSGAEIDALTEVEANEYHDAFKKNSDETIATLKTSIEAIKEDKDAEKELNAEKMKSLNAQIEVISKTSDLLKLRLDGKSEKSSKGVVDSIVKALENNADAIKNIKTNRRVEFTSKGY